ncbi:MAG: hypothetical protein ABI068_04905 [Ktedonobacterales bacterium]
MEHENFDDVLREDWPDEERTTNLDEQSDAAQQQTQQQAQGQGSDTATPLPPPPQNMSDPRIDDNATRPPTPPDA